jgi:hypothetical protein
MDRQYAKVPRGRRHHPTRARDVRKYRDCLRLDFGFECGYCLAREAEVGPGDPFGGYQIDHFRPRSLFKNRQHVYDNLVWTCTLCNRAKGDAWPSQREQDAGIRFLDPVEDALGEHVFTRGETVDIIDASPSGEFFVEALRLNAAAHRERRRRREKLNTALRTALSVLSQLAARNPAAQAISTALNEVQGLRREVGESLPWDAPSSCRCSVGLSSVPNTQTPGPMP